MGIIANFKAAPPRLQSYGWHNMMAHRRRHGLSWPKTIQHEVELRLPWSRGDGKAYIFHYRELMLAQHRGICWRRRTSSGYGQEPGRGWGGEFPTGNQPIGSWLKYHFWWSLPRPWRYFQGCQCYTLAGEEGIETDSTTSGDGPCGGNRSKYGCMYS